MKETLASVLVASSAHSRTDLTKDPTAGDVYFTDGKYVGVFDQTKGSCVYFAEGVEAIPYRSHGVLVKKKSGEVELMTGLHRSTRVSLPRGSEFAISPRGNVGYISSAKTYTMDDLNGGMRMHPKPKNPRNIQYPDDQNLFVIANQERGSIGSEAIDDLLSSIHDELGGGQNNRSIIKLTKGEKILGDSSILISRACGDIVDYDARQGKIAILHNTGEKLSSRRARSKGGSGSDVIGLYDFDGKSIKGVVESHIGGGIKDSFISHPRFSPDGSKLAWLMSDQNFNNYQFFVTNVKTDELLTMMSLPEGRRVHDLNWMNDSRNAIFTISDRHGRYGNIVDTHKNVPTGVITGHKIHVRK